MTHTPGPWTTSSDNEGDEYAFCIVQNKNWRGQQFIARVEPYGVYEGLDEAEANARLIAAAPELLSVLEALVAEHCAPKYGTLEHRQKIWADAQAAIAKAKGE